MATIYNHITEISLSHGLHLEKLTFDILEPVMLCISLGLMVLAELTHYRVNEMADVY